MKPRWCWRHPLADFAWLLTGDVEGEGEEKLDRKRQPEPLSMCSKQDITDRKFRFGEILGSCTACGHADLRRAREPVRTSS